MVFEDKFIDNSSFIKLTKDMVDFIKKVRFDFRKFDLSYKKFHQRIDFVRKNKSEIFKQFTEHFDKIWDIVNLMDRNNYFKYRTYYQELLLNKIILNSEINKHIYYKPLGYSGDYQIMNYIYDFHGDENYLGHSSYEMLINNYSCNIDISCSNIRRKNYFKKKISEVITTNNNAKILNVACGPARELIELMEENQELPSFDMVCLDQEKKALDYLQNKLSTLRNIKNKSVRIIYENKDIASFFKKELFKKKAANYDLVYASGLFDYLNDRSCKKLVSFFCDLLKSTGEFIVCNADRDNQRQCAYYEFLQEWELLYRTKLDMLNWSEALQNVDVEFVDFPEKNNYLFLKIKKKS